MFRILKKRFTVLMALMIVISLVFSACSESTNNLTNTSASNEKSANEDSSKDTNEDTNKDGYKEDPEDPDIDTFVTTWNTGALETMCGNPFVSGGVPFGDFVYDSLFDYSPLPKDTFLPAIGESFEENGTELTVKLKKDVKWSDGKDFTSKDVLNTFNIAFINNSTVWTYLDKVEAPDDYTVVFRWKKAGPILKQMALTVKINAPYHIYGKWGDQAIPLIAKRDENGKLDKDSDNERLKIREDLLAFKPGIENVVGTGGWVYDSSTSSEILLNKRNDAWCSQNINFEHVKVVRFTTQEASTPAIMAGEYDGDQIGYTPDVFEQIQKARPDMKVFWVPFGGQPTMFFNTSKYPINDPLVRKAIAYVIDKDALNPILEVGMKPADTYISGLVPSFRDLWLKKDFLSKLTNYTYNASKAEELLKQAGWEKGSDGFWRDGKGQLVQLEVSSMNNWPVFFLGGDAIVNQLNQFGLKSEFKPMEYGAYNDYVKNGQHTIALNFIGDISYGHPWGAYKNIYVDNMTKIGLKDPKDTSSERPDLKIKTSSGEIIDVYSTIDQLFYTNDVNEQIKLIEKLAMATNEFVPFVPIAEKTVPYKLYHTDNKFTGYPEDPTDPVWFGGDTPSVYSKLLKYGKLDVKK